MANAADPPPSDKPSKEGDADAGHEDRLQDRSRQLGDRIKSVQRKAFLKRNRHELGVNLGATLNDSFFYTFTLGGNYTYHVREAFSLAIDAKWWYKRVASDAVRVIRATQVATPAETFKPVMTLSGEAQIAPIYGKMSLLSEKIIHYDLYVAAGFGAVMTDAVYNTGPNGWHPMGTVALGARIATTDWLTVRVEVRDQIYADRGTTVCPSGRDCESAIQNMLSINLGVSFFLPPSFDYRYE